MITVHQSEVEAAALAEETCQRGLGTLRTVLHHTRHPCVLEELRPAPREPRRLGGVECHVPARRVDVREQALADVERRYAVSEPDLDRLGRSFPYYPTSQGLSLGGARRNREQVVASAVRTRQGVAITDQALYCGAHPPRVRAAVAMLGLAHASIPPAALSPSRSHGTMAGSSTIARPPERS
jgi:hypothetical protein